MKHITNYKIFEANIANDTKNYDLASDFYDKMIVELENGNYTTLKDGSKVLKGSDVSYNYYNLLILFIDKNADYTKPPFGNAEFKAGYAFGKTENNRVIILNNLRDGNAVYQGINKESFIHEFIHYLDSQRSKKYSPNFSDKTTLSDYYNSPFEFNAYYQASATFVTKMLQQENLLKLFKEKYKTYDIFYKWMIEIVFDKSFIKNLNTKNLIKLKKRVYTIYQEYLND